MAKTYTVNEVEQIIQDKTNDLLTDLEVSNKLVKNLYGFLSAAAEDKPWEGDLKVLLLQAKSFTRA